MTSQSDGQTQNVMTPSNVITIIRILLVPLFVAALLAPWPTWFGMDRAFDTHWKGFIAAGVFVVISATDWLDGYLARSRNEVTDFGKFMDPLADKILVAAALIALVELGSLPTWVVLVILAREFIVSGVRMMAASKGVVIAASMLGKFKTVFQMIAIVLFTIKDSYMFKDIGEAFSDKLWVFSWFVMIIAIILTIASMMDYLVKAREIIGLGPSSLIEEDGGASAPLPDQVIATARAKGVKIATAESLTGGMIGQALTSVAGSSEAYLGGVVSYASDVKEGVLGVKRPTIEGPGVVSETCAIEMADGVRALVGSDIAVSVTGIAGPGGAEPGKPVGTVWIGFSTKGGSRAEEHHFEGTRDEVRAQTAEAALRGMLACMQ